jgi:hypothetical protein
MTIRTLAGGGLAVGLLTALAACAPAYYPPHPAYYARPVYHHAPSQSATSAQTRPEKTQNSSDWVNPEPVQSEPGAIAR